MHSQSDLALWWYTKRCPQHGDKGNHCGLRDVVHRMGKPAVRQIAVWHAEGQDA